MRNMALAFIASVLVCLPEPAAPEKGRVLTGKDTADNIQVRLVAVQPAEV